MKKESIVSKYDKTILKIKALSRERESVRRKLMAAEKKLFLKAKQLTTTAKEEKCAKNKLTKTLEQLRRKAQQFEAYIREKEDVRHKLVATEEQLRSKVENLALATKEKESFSCKLTEVETQLHLKTKNLEQIKAKDEAIISSIGDGLAAIDENANITMVNRAFEKMLGWKEKEVLGKSIYKILPVVDENGKEVPKSKRLVTKVLKEHIDIAAKVNYLRKDKTFFPVSTNLSPIAFKGGFIGVVGVFMDITKEKEIDRAKTEFVSLASHQLRTPLSVVKWYSEMLLSGDAGELSDKQKKYLAEVYKGNQRMITLVNSLLNVSRLELGTIKIDPKPTDIVKLAEEEITEFKIQIDQKKLKFDERHSEGLPLFNIDPKLLRPVLQNLFSNAIKYTPDKGKISLDLRLVKRGKLAGNRKVNEDSILIAVSDTGFGIPKNQQNKIFTKLFRADNAWKKDPEGAGLGLYIVKSILDRSGGLIWFESEENKGTTFYVTLPLTGMKKKEGAKSFS